MNCKLLLVDNTTAIANPWKQVLIENFLTAEAVGGFEAINRFKLEEFDIVIVNISLDHLNGVDAVRKIREKYYFVPIIVLYKQADLLSLKQVKSYGIQQALPLPVNIKQLLIILSKLIPAHKLKEKLNVRIQKPGKEASESAANSYINIEEIFYEGLSAIASSHFEKAIEIYTSLLNLSNIKHEVWLHYLNEAFFQLGHCYAHLKDYSSSNKYFAQFITKAPRHNFVREALLHMGQNYEVLQNFTKAAQYYQKVLKIRPMDSYTTRARKLLASLEKSCANKQR